MLQNNINITTTTTLCCDVECTTTTTIPCVDPIDHLFNVANTYAEVNVISKIDALISVLDEGLLLNNCDVCCLSCGYLNPSYAFGSKLVFESLYPTYALATSNENNTLKNLNSDNDSCCRNIYGTYPEESELDNFNRNRLNCCNGFLECTESIYQYFVDNTCETAIDISNLLNLYNTLVITGIYEQGTDPSGETYVCKIFDHIKEYLGVNCFVNEFFQILNKGIIIHCDGDLDYIFISSAQTYINTFNTSAP